MTTKTGDAETAERLMIHARQLYHNLATELTKALRFINADVEDDGATKRVETIRAHRKALQTLLDLQFQIMKERGEAGAGHELDLEAARAEILGRLTRLAPQGGD